MPHPFHEMFARTTPPLPEKFAFRMGRPCLFEQLSQNDLGPPDVCPHRPVCEKTCGWLSTVMERAYDHGICVTLAEPSTNIVCRSESHYYGGEHSRFSLRKHIHEVEEPAENRRFRQITAEMIKVIIEDLKGDRDPRLSQESISQIVSSFEDSWGKEDKREYVSESDLRTKIDRCLRALLLDEELKKRLGGKIWIHASRELECRPIGKTNKFGRYLGFVDVRTSSVRSPIALALLVPPRSLRHDPDVYVITGEYGYLTGAAGFASTVFSMYDQFISGACCAQVCVIMGLAALADRGAKVIGSYDITYLAKLPKAQPISPPQYGSCLMNHDGVKGVIEVAGLELEEIRRVLTDRRCRANAHLFAEEDQDDETIRRLAARLIEAYLLARYPVILSVDPGVWWPGHKSQLVKPAGTKRIEMHGVVVIGMRRASRRSGPGKGIPRPEITELIIHDPGRGPFMKRPIKECLDAAVARPLDPSAPSGDPAASRPRGPMQMIFVTERKIERSAANCVRAILDEDDKFDGLFGSYFHAARSPVAGEWRKDQPPVRDYRIALVNHLDLVSAFAAPEYDKSSLKFDRAVSLGQMAAAIGRQAWLEERLRRLEKPGWYWCVSAYSDARMDFLWLFHAGGKDDEPEDDFVEFPGGGW